MRERRVANPIKILPWNEAIPYFDATGGHDRVGWSKHTKSSQAVSLEQCWFVGQILDVFRWMQQAVLNYISVETDCSLAYLIEMTTTRRLFGRLSDITMSNCSPRSKTHQSFYAGNQFAFTLSRDLTPNCLILTSNAVSIGISLISSRADVKYKSLRCPVPTANSILRTHFLLALSWTSRSCSVFHCCV